MALALLFDTFASSRCVNWFERKWRKGG